jgi:glycosyltransferase involved in cell wall biosynthesis
MMKIWAITMVANEEDIIAYNLSHMLSQGIDRILVADNLSTDRTPYILQRIEADTEGLIMIIRDEEPGYYQSEKMTKLANFAGELGADFILPFDADELWYSMTPGATIGDIIRSNQNIEIIGVPMWNHYVSPKDLYSDNPFIRMVCRDSKQNPIDKVAFQYVRGLKIGQGNHNVYIAGKNVPGEAIGLGIRHFPYRSADHFIRKIRVGAKAYAATNLPENLGAHWRQYGASLEAHGEEAMKAHYRNWFTWECPGMEMIFDPAPYTGEL